MSDLRAAHGGGAAALSRRYSSPPDTLLSIPPARLPSSGRLRIVAAIIAGVTVACGVVAALLAAALQSGGGRDLSLVLAGAGFAAGLGVAVACRLAGARTPDRRGRLVAGLTVLVVAVALVWAVRVGIGLWLAGVDMEMLRASAGASFGLAILPLLSAPIVATFAVELLAWAVLVRTLSSPELSHLA